MADEIKALRISNEAMHDPAELRRRMADEGYLFFKRLQNPDKMRELRREMMTTIQRVGWLVAGTDPLDGIADISRQCTEGDREYSAGYSEVYKLQAFHRSAHWPEVTDMVEKIVGRPIMPHPQKIARIWFPKYTEHTTPTHQDFVHFQGNFETYTCWAPVGDCPIELGGLAVIPGSHKVNRVLEHHFALGAGGLIVDTEAEPEIDPVWHSTDYAMGDTLIFPALTIHKALPNYTEDKLRLSLDNRYQAVGDAIAEHMLEPHGPSALRWEEVYTNWSGDDLQYYWRQFDNPVVPRDMSYAEKGFAEALELARAGNEQALYRLRRTIKSDPDSPGAQKARAVLAEMGVA
ncbi:MAG: phytanoyl-CoA dioxygenase family protein [Chloroflexi bacterium]|nr:phytanoyl-CoA dioxygenase family protein [Chloroflexota bacterium]